MRGTYEVKVSNVNVSFTLELERTLQSFPVTAPPEKPHLSRCSGISRKAAEAAVLLSIAKGLAGF